MYSTNKDDLKDRLDAMRSYEKNSYLAYDMKIAVVSISFGYIAVVSVKLVQVFKPPYIFISGYTKEYNERNELGTDFLHVCGSLKGMIFLNNSVDGVSCESKWVKQNIHNFLCRQF